MAQRAGISFELERLDLEGDELVVSGHWSGVRGLRFVRPTLVAEDRRILATLEHKPWAPAMDRTWTAAFPWEGDDVDAQALLLAVAPQVTVPLGDAEPEPIAEPEPAAEPKPAEDAKPKAKPEPTAEVEPADAPASAPPQRQAADRLQALEAELDAVTRERDALRRRLEDAELVAADRERRAGHEAGETLDDLTRARAAAERDRDRALAQLEEAVTAREAAVRTRARMELAHDEARREREAAEAELANAQAQRDEANAQRDEVLLAYRGLQRHVQTERAQADRENGDGPPPEGGADEPIGVRTMPAARTVMAELQRPKPAVKLPFSHFDLWVVRILGTVAGGCFILLLVSILRVFI